MDGWRAISVLIRVGCVAVIFAALTIFTIRHLPGAGSAPSINVGDSGSHHGEVLRLGGGADLEMNIACGERRDVPEGAIAHLQSRAKEDGDKEAQFILGLAYLRGIGVRCDQHEGGSNIEAAADQRYPAAQFILGVLQEFGKGGERKDLEAAEVSFRDAARGGNVAAMSRYAQLLLMREADHAEIELWLRRAADYGDSDSQFNLGLLYWRGEFGFRRSVEDAFFWLTVAGLYEDQAAARLANKISGDLDSEDDEKQIRSDAKHWTAATPKPEANPDFEKLMNAVGIGSDSSDDSEPQS